jgi:DNA anti-recombination protein RmuC
MTDWIPIREKVEKMKKGLEAAQQAVELLVQQNMQQVENVAQTLEALEDRNGKGKVGMGRDTNDRRSDRD